MMKYVFMIFIWGALFLFAPFAHAAVEITEIMYDLDGTDSKREWIEIHNSGSTERDLGGWRLYEAESNHKLTLSNESDTFVLPAGAYAIIADDASIFLSEQSDFSGVLFDSSFSLKNSGEQIILRDADLADVDTILYDPELGAGGDGNSLQKINGSWQAAAPTPGAVNHSGGGESGGSSDLENQAAESSAGDAESGSIMVAPVEPQIFAFAHAPRMQTVGADSVFYASALGLQKEPLLGARYVWSFGDGSITEGEKVRHYYQHPGTYAVFLSVSSGKYAALDKIVVEVAPAKIAISRSTLGEDGFIELHNQDEKELDISLWYLAAGAQKFIFPEHTHILPHTKIAFPARITGVVLTSDFVVPILFYPNGREVETASASLPSVSALFPSPPIKDPSAYTSQEKQNMKKENKEKQDTNEKAQAAYRAPYATPDTASGAASGVFSDAVQTKTSGIIPRALAAAPPQVFVAKEESTHATTSSYPLRWAAALFTVLSLLAGGILFLRIKEKEHTNISAEAYAIHIKDY